MSFVLFNEDKEVQKENMRKENMQKENMQKEITKEEKKQRTSKAFNFLLFLIGLLLITYMLKINIRTKRINIAPSLHPLLSFVYISFYAVISGLLIYYGIDNFNKFFEIYIEKSAIVDLISTSIVIAFSYLYSAYIEKIVTTVTGLKITIDLYKNVLGYVLARTALITGLYFAN